MTNDNIKFKDIYEKLYYSYLAYYDKIWDNKTYASESSKLKTIIRVMRLSGLRGIDFYGILKAEGYKPYTIKALVQRAASLYRHGQEQKFLSTFNNPMYDLLVKSPQLFRNAYKPERLKLDFDEALTRIKTIEDEATREMCLALLKSGLRIHEAYKVNYVTASVIGKGDKERFTAFTFPAHLEMPSEYRVRTELKKLGLKPHSLRKLLATKLSRSDLRHADIMKIMGWSSIETASKYFQSLNEEQLKQKMKEITENEQT